MNTIHTTPEQYFRQLIIDRERTQCAWMTICQTIDASLKVGDFEKLLSLIPYMEEGDGQYAFQYIGETHRVLCVIHIIQVECQYGKIPFCTGCESMQNLMEKYMLTLFSLRRLCFRLSLESEEEAIAYLSENRGMSIFAIYIILKEDLIHADKALYRKIKEIYADIWMSDELELLESMIKMG